MTLSPLPQVLASFFATLERASVEEEVQADPRQLLAWMHGAVPGVLAVVDHLTCCGGGGGQQAAMAASAVEVMKVRVGVGMWEGAGGKGGRGGHALVVQRQSVGAWQGRRTLPALSSSAVFPPRPELFCCVPSPP